MPLRQHDIGRFRFIIDNTEFTPALFRCTLSTWILAVLWNIWQNHLLPPPDSKGSFPEHICLYYMAVLTYRSINVSIDCYLTAKTRWDTQWKNKRIKRRYRTGTEWRIQCSFSTIFTYNYRHQTYRVNSATVPCHTLPPPRPHRTGRIHFKVLTTLPLKFKGL